MSAVYALLAVFAVDLGSDSWSRREAATAALRAFGPLAAMHVQLASHSTDPEIRWRACTLLGEIRRGQVESWIAAQGQLPWIDSAPSMWPFPDEWIHCLEMGREEVTRKGQPLHAQGNWLEYRYATGHYLRECLNNGGLTFSAAADLLRVMRARCEVYARMGSYPAQE